MADIIYTFEGGPYFNITNKCPCKVAFSALGIKRMLWAKQKKCGMISARICGC